MQCYYQHVDLEDRNVLEHLINGWREWQKLFQSSTTLLMAGLRNELSKGLQKLKKILVKLNNKINHGS